MAGNRAVEHLREHFERLQLPSTEVARSLLINLQQQAASQAQPQTATASAATLLEKSSQEDQVASWLTAHGISDSWELTPALVDSNLSPECLDTVAEQVGAESLSSTLTWIASTLAIDGLLREIKHCTTRISQMVGAVKAYSYMDQAPLQEVDIHEGISCTLLMLRHKIKPGITVCREYDQTLPHICVYGSALNQVWTHVIDNAIDAMDGQGQLQIRTARENAQILVEIIDSGSGIPPEIQSRIFEPFFTIKGVGQGTGLGLSVSYRIVVEIHKGSIRVLSKPGKTCFQVRLPLKQC
ncbi:MAG: hypothetical protein F6J97_26875 [Leptolyngbya sp. SIO4C1]|nr:hypothetical protein [Leptolyngbya sp. SIO4C1]